MEVIGAPTEEFLSQASRKNIFFDSHGECRVKTNSRGRRRVPGTRVLKNVLNGADEEFFLLIEACLRWNPAERIKPEDALNMNWFLENTDSFKSVYKHKKISLEDVTRHVPSLQKFIAHRTQLSEA